MKILFSLALFLSATTSFAQKGIATVEIQTSAVCEMCKETIEKELAFTKGVTAAVLDVETAIATVSYRTDKTDLEQLRKAINRVGYDADDSPAEQKAYDKLHHCCQKDGHK